MRGSMNVNLGHLLYLEFQHTQQKFINVKKYILTLWYRSFIIKF